MNVALHVGQLNQSVPGGIATYIRALVQELPLLDVGVKTFAAGPVPRGIPESNHTRLSGPSGGLRYELWHQFRRPRLKVHADVLHAPSLAIPPTSGVPLVVSVHDLAFIEYPGTLTKRGVRFHQRGLEITHNEASEVIVPSEATKQSLVKWGIPKERIHVAPYGVTVHPEPATSEVMQRNLGLDTPFVLAVGTIEPRKGFDFLADVMRDVRQRLGDIPLVIAGQPGWGDVPNLDQPFVRQLGLVAPDVLEMLYRAATIVAVPSRYEGFGFPALEAMSRGAPVVASRASSLPEIVGSAGTLVDPQDHAAWVSAICELLDSPTKRTEYSEQGILQAKQFTWDRCARAHVEVYKSMPG